MHPERCSAVTVDANGNPALLNPDYLHCHGVPAANGGSLRHPGEPLRSLG
jgi:hypothetical protein